MTTATKSFLTYANAKNDGDLETAMDVWHPDALLKIPAVDVTLEGRDQARAFFAHFLDALEGYRGEVVHLGADGDTVIADWVLQGKLTAPLLGAEPTGAELELPVLSIAEIRDGLFVTETLRFDLASLARQAEIPLDQLLDQLDLQQEPHRTQQDRTDSRTEAPDPSPAQDPARDHADLQASDHPTSGTRAFLDAFIEGWQAPQSAEEFLDHFLPHVDAHVRLRQPLGTELGHTGFARVFRRLFTLMPDVHGEVQEALPLPDGLLIILRMRGSLGRSNYEWTVVDRITLRDGRLIEREALFDPMPLLAAIVRRPSAWPRALRSLLL